MSKQPSPHDSPAERSPVDRLADEVRILRVVCRMLADDIAGALAAGEPAERVLASLGVPLDELDVLLERAADALRRLTT